MFVPMMAGIFPPPLREASRCSTRKRRIPRTASKPYTSPPVRSSAWRSMNVFPRSEAAVSYVPGQPPRASAKAIAGGSRSTTVVPVRRLMSCAWPTRTPRIAVSVEFAAMASTRNFAGTAGAVFNGCATASTDSAREIRDGEGDLARGEFRHHEFRWKFFRGEDARAWQASRVDHHNRSRGRRRGQEAFRGRAPTAVRLPMFHRQRGPHGGFRCVAFRAMHLDDNPERPRKRPDQGRRLRHRGHERIAERDLREADLHLVVRPQEAQGIEGMDRPLEFRVDVVFVVDPAHRLPKVGWQREDLLVPEPVHAPLPNRRRELIEFVPARGLLLTEFLSVPNDRIGQRRADEYLARIEREAVRGLLSGGRLADQDPVDFREAVRNHTCHDVGDPRVRTHRDDRADLPIPPTRVQRELLEDT